MSRWPTLLLVLALLAAACTEAVETATTSSQLSTSSETTTSQVQPTTSSPVTEVTQTTTTTASTTTTTAGPMVTVIDIVLEGGTVERVERFDLLLNGAVRLVVTADVSDEIHLHGYDLHADVSPGEEAVIEFDATIPGVFEIELEDSGVLIGELQVAP